MLVFYLRLLHMTKQYIKGITRKKYNVNYPRTKPRTKPRGKPRCHTVRRNRSTPFFKTKVVTLLFGKPIKISF